MKQKRRIKAIIRRLEGNSDSDSILAKKVLEWVLDDGADFNEVISSIEEPQSKTSLNLFAYDKPQEVWVMVDPFYDNKVFIENTRPSHTPPSWWKRVPLDDLTEEVSFGEDPLRLTESYTGETISWIEIDNIFNHFRDLFRTRKSVEKYVEFFFKVDWSDMVTISASERKVFQQENKVSPSELKRAIEDYLNSDWKYDYTKNKENIWALQRRKSED